MLVQQAKFSAEIAFHVITLQSHLPTTESLQEKKTTGIYL